MRLFDPLTLLSDLVERLRERETAFSDKVVYAENLSVDDQTGNLVVRNGRSTEYTPSRGRRSSSWHRNSVSRVGT